MQRVEWRPAAIDDLVSIVDYISDDNPVAAQALKDEIESKVALLPHAPRVCRLGRVKGTREMIVRPNYVLIYAEGEKIITVLRVLHAAQQWP